MPKANKIGAMSRKKAFVLFFLLLIGNSLMMVSRAGAYHHPQWMEHIYPLAIADLPPYTLPPPRPPLRLEHSKPLNTIPPIRVPKAKIAIIIDDMGYNLARGKAALELPGAITYAIIPSTPNATYFAQQARQLKKEVMLHAPMSTINHLPLGENGLTENMTEMEFKAALNKALNSLPHAVGLNNHMGSLLTQKQQPMEWVMDALRERQLYFIDSRTTSQSIALQVAQAFDIPALKRDVFLDHKATPNFIDQQFNRLIEIAHKQGYGVAIAHPHKETILYLQQHLPNLRQQGIALVSASELVNVHSKNRK